MIFLLTSFSLNNTIILLVFGVIILILGIYTLYNVRGMQKTGTPPPWLIPDQEAARIKEKEEFCEAIRPRTMGLGITCILYGAYTVFEYFAIGLYLAKVAGVVALLVVVIWFFTGLNKIKTKYMQE